MKHWKKFKQKPTKATINNYLNLLNNLKKTTMETKFKNEITERTKFTFKKFTEIDETFEGILTEKITLKGINGELSEAYLFNSNDEIYCLPTHAKLSHKLNIVYNGGNGIGTECRIIYIGKVKTDKGMACDYRVLTA